MRKVYMTVILRAIYWTGFFSERFSAQPLSHSEPGSEFPLLSLRKGACRRVRRASAGAFDDAARCRAIRRAAGSRRCVRRLATEASSHDPFLPPQEHSRPVPCRRLRHHRPTDGPFRAARPLYESSSRHAAEVSFGARKLPRASGYLRRRAGHYRRRSVTRAARMFS